MPDDDKAPATEPTGELTPPPATPTPAHVPEPIPEPVRKAPAAWAQEKSTPPWQYAGAHAGNRWAVFDLPITENEYDEAIKKAAEVVCR